MRKPRPYPKPPRRKQCTFLHIEMIRIATSKEVSQQWDTFKPAIHEALNSSTGARQTIGFHSEAIKRIYNKLTNPFNSDMQLWLSETDALNYIALTQLQCCEFTQRRTLLWFSITKVRDVSIEDTIQTYQEGQLALTQFAKENDCVGISGYTDLEYFKKKVDEDWKGSVTRYFFYLPLQ